MTNEHKTERSKDKTTIGLTQRAREVAEMIKENEGLEDLRDVAVVGLGVAVNAGTGLGSIKDAVTTWNVGSFDTSGQLRELVVALYDDLDTPFRQIEYLVNVGLERLGAEYEGAESSTTLSVVLDRLS